MTHSEAIAHHVHGLRADTVPPQVLEKARTCTLYAVAMGMASLEAGDAVFHALSTVHRVPGHASVLGAAQRLRATDAAAINSALIGNRGQNDTHPDTVTHIGCVVVPAVLALAEERALPFEQALLAILAGYETVPKLARGAAAQAIARGFRSTALFGVLGVAAACARLIGLSTERTVHALALASNSAGGLMQCWEEGSAEWRFHLAHASRLGMEAALLAEQGFGGARAALDGAKGFYRAFAGEVPELRLSGWDILDVTYKPFPGCAFNQAGIQALCQLLATERLRGADIRELTLAMHPADAAYPGVDAAGPFDSFAGAIMSAQFMAAATLRDGQPRRRHFTQEFASAELHRLARGIRVQADPGLAPWTARATVRLADGSARSASFAESRPFVWRWQQAVDRLAPVVSEWSIDDAAGRFARLSAAVGGAGGAAASTRQLMQACVPA